MLAFKFDYFSDIFIQSSSIKEEQYSLKRPSLSSPLK